MKPITKILTVCLMAFWLGVAAGSLPPPGGKYASDTKVEKKAPLTLKATQLLAIDLCASPEAYVPAPAELTIFKAKRSKLKIADNNITKKIYLLNCCIRQCLPEAATADHGSCITPN